MQRRVGAYPTNHGCVCIGPFVTVAVAGAAGEGGLSESVQYLQQLTEQLQNGEPAAVALVTGALLPAYIEAIARASAACVPAVREVPVSCQAPEWACWVHPHSKQQHGAAAACMLWARFSSAICRLALDKL